MKPAHLKRTFGACLFLVLALGAAGPAGAVNTPAGNNVAVHLEDPFPGMDTGIASMSVTFGNVTEAGTTTATLSDANAQPHPEFLFFESWLPAGIPFSREAYFNISTTAKYTGPITICIYTEDQVHQKAVLLFHWENDEWVDTCPELEWPCGDEFTYMCGNVNSLSSVNTPAGNHVVVQVTDAETEVSITLNFEHVAVAGTTTIAFNQDGPEAPAGFLLLPLGGANGPIYLDITTTAEFSGPVEICLSFGDLPSAAVLLHYLEDEATWEQVGAFDGQEVCGSVTSLSPFALAVPLKFYFTDSSHGGTALARVQRANLDGGGREPLVPLGFGNARFIALDMATERMYWTDSGTIFSANLDGSDVQDLNIPDGFSPMGIALDITAEKVYWTDETGHGNNIRRANLNGSGVEVLLSGLGLPRGLALDPDAGKLYWTETGGQRIRRANLDGSGLENVVEGLSFPQGIALDVSHGKMYWADDDRIQRANLNGSDVETVVTGLGNPLGLAIDPAAGKVYWTDIAAKKIQRANLDGSGVEDLVTANLDTPWGIALETQIATVPVNTPTGNDVVVELTDPDTEVSVTLSFANVAVAGTTTITVSQDGPETPAGFLLLPLGGINAPIYLDISTTAEFEGPIQICLTFGDDQRPPNAAVLLHYLEAVDAWEEVGVFDGQQICGTITTLSPFVLGVPLLSVQIDIKPGSYPNSINLGSKGVVPVAIFSTQNFDATQVDPTSVTLADAAVKVRGNGTPQASFEDVNNDGLIDLIVHVDTQGLQLTAGDTQAELRGMTLHGQHIRGTDTVRIVK